MKLFYYMIPAFFFALLFSVLCFYFPVSAESQESNTLEYALTVPKDNLRIHIPESDMPLFDRCDNFVILNGKDYDYIAFYRVTGYMSSVPMFCVNSNSVGLVSYYEGVGKYNLTSYDFVLFRINRTNRALYLLNISTRSGGSPTSFPNLYALNDIVGTQYISSSRVLLTSGIQPPTSDFINSFKPLEQIQTESISTFYTRFKDSVKTILPAGVVVLASMVSFPLIKRILLYFLGGKGGGRKHV